MVRAGTLQTRITLGVPYAAWETDGNRAPAADGPVDPRAHRFIL